MKKNELSVERMIELERYIPINSNNRFGWILNLHSNNSYNYLEVEYMIRAFLIPKQELEKDIAIYEETKSLINKKKFIDDLTKKYKTTKQEIIERIEEIEKINNINYISKKVKRKK